MLFFIGEIMGNEESFCRKIRIDDEAVEVTDNWSLHYAKDTDTDVGMRSAFVSLSKSTQPEGGLLEKFAKNLMIHRHPFIIKYISSWHQNSRTYLITEEVQPLSLVIANQSALKICVGLYNILNALVFLHEKANASHNNICCASIYVTPEGVWKLGGLEYLKKFSDMSPRFLKETRASRYEKAIPPEEDSLLTDASVNAEAIDKFGFGVLVEELLKKKTEEEIPLLLDFREYCKKNLVNSNSNERAKLSEVLRHPFFNHDFIRISRFLFDLPIKSSSEKERFFRDLTEQLHLLPEDVVGSQLASSLLSRVVFLDTTAQKHFLPVVLRPRSAKESNEIRALFSENLFKKYVVPKLLQIFCVRDAQIRLLMLEHFHLFCNSFTTDQLKNQVLPELLVGIKDVDDRLVSTTLKALSQMVMVLGASTVIGGKRAKLFSDGRPDRQASASPKNGKAKRGRERSRSNTGADADGAFGPAEEPFARGGLPERPSPDGGEDESSSPPGPELEGESEGWSDWDAVTCRESSKIVQEKTTGGDTKSSVKGEDDSSNTFLADIASLDIKSGADEETSAKEVDYFRDMEPVISKTQVLSIGSEKTKFDVESTDVESNWDCWGEDWELGEVP